MDHVVCAHQPPSNIVHCPLLSPHLRHLFTKLISCHQFYNIPSPLKWKLSSLFLIKLSLNVTRRGGHRPRLLGVDHSEEHLLQAGGAPVLVHRADYPSHGPGLRWGLHLHLDVFTTKMSISWPTVVTTVGDQVKCLGVCVWARGSQVPQQYQPLQKKVDKNMLYWSP